MALFPIFRAFLAQLHRSGSRSVAFLQGQLCSRSWLAAAAALDISASGAAAHVRHMETSPATTKRALCQEFPLAVCRDSWRRAEWVLGLSRRGKNKHGKHLCAPKICLQLNHKMLV